MNISCALHNCYISKINLNQLIIFIFSVGQMNRQQRFQFVTLGQLHFTQRKEPLPSLTQSMTGKTFVITGSNSGIGYSAAKEAAKRGAFVVLLCRSKEKGEDAVKRLREETGIESINLVLCQVGIVESMQKAANELKELLNTIDILVHNSGCMIHERQFTKENIEKNFATNTFGVYYLSKLLMPLMTQTSRTIVVSSGGCLTEQLVTGDIYMQEEEFNGTIQYARNKRQQLCIVQQFAKKHPENGKFFSMHPGWVDTPSIKEAMPKFYNKMKDKLRKTEEGADTIIYLSVIESEKLKNGQFYFDREVSDKHMISSITSYKQEEVDILMEKLNKMSQLE